MTWASSDHGVVAVNAQGAPIMDNEGRIVAAVVAFHHTTERKSPSRSVVRRQRGVVGCRRCRPRPTIS